MAKGMKKVRTGGISRKGKGKRWRKGQSCLTNPTVKTFRSESAKTRMHATISTDSDKRSFTSSLTAENLAQLNDNHMNIDPEVASEGGASSRTFLSGVTDCTNPTFSIVRRYWERQTSSQKEVCAVLAAVTEIIRENGGKETEVEYFGALMSFLETLEDQESISATFFLLSLAIKNSNSSLIKSILACLGFLLKSQDDVVWSDLSTMQTFHGILSFTTDPKPKVRKAAHQTVVSILRASSCIQDANIAFNHPAASATAKYCIQEIETHGGAGEAASTCHVLELLKSVLVTFPKKSVKEVCETILKVMTLSNVVVSSVAMQALHSLLSSFPSSSTLPADLNARLINAVYDFQPAENDTQPMLAWLAVMESAHVNLFKSDSDLCMKHFPRIFKSCLGCLQSEKAEIALGASQVMKTLISTCLSQAVVDSPSTYSLSIKKTFSLLEGGLAYKYHASWGLILQVLGMFFKAAGKTGHSYMRKCLQSICDLRSTHQFAFMNELDRCIGEAVIAMGPSQVLEAVPLQITGNEDNCDFPRSWLLPIIRDHVRDTELQFFTQYFLPLAAKLKTKSLELSDQGRTIEARSYDIIQSQIWSMLPGFCKSPTDVKSAFKGIARILGSALTNRPDIRSEVCAGLRNIIKTNEYNDENKAEIGRFAKNYLPILFNLYTTETEGSDKPEASVFETIKAYLQVADQKVVGDLTNKICEKLGSSDEKQMPVLMDLLIAMVPHANKQLVSQIFGIIKPKVESVNHSIQKKSYRVLEEICCCESLECKQFMDSVLIEFESLLVKSVSSASPSSKAPRLKCLLQIVKNLPESKEDFLETIIPEVILCTKESNSKARENAFCTLVEIGNALVRISDENKEDTIRRYLGMLAAGLAGTPHMVSGTVLAFTRVVFEFKDVLEGQLLSNLVETVQALLQSKGREIIRSSLALVKVLIQVTQDDTLAPHVQDLVTSVGKLSEANSRSLGSPIKAIYKKLIRRYGYEMILKMAVSHHQKMVRNLHKIESRAKRRMAAKDKEDNDDRSEATSALRPSKPKPVSIEEILQETDSEDEEEEKKPEKIKKKQKIKQGTAWLKENHQEEPLDFLDPGISKRVMATKPETEPKKASQVKHDFKLLPDGRFFITEPSADEVSDKRRANPKSGNDVDRILDEALTTDKKSGKRRRDDYDSSDDEDLSAPKYKAGGSGIHRPVTSQSRPSGSEYKAKKAGGDVKRKGRPDPFAYIPLSRQQLNRRKKIRASAQWKLTKSGRKNDMKRNMKIKKS